MECVVDQVERCVGAAATGSADELVKVDEHVGEHGRSHVFRQAAEGRVGPVDALQVDGGQLVTLSEFGGWVVAGTSAQPGMGARVRDEGGGFVDEADWAYAHPDGVERGAAFHHDVQAAGDSAER